MADVAEDNKVVEATPADEVKETVKEVVKEKEVADPPAAEAENEKADPPAAAAETKEGETESETPKQNGKDTEENGTANGKSEADSEDAERKRKSDVAAGDEADGTTAVVDGVSAEKKAKLEDKSEDGAVAEAPSNGEQGVVA